MRKQKNRMTTSEENYIKAIFHLGKQKDHLVNTNALALEMETKPSSVTDMVKKLAEKEIVSYQPYKGVRLTEIGLKTALMLIRKHRLWEVFLVNHLDFAWDEVHEVAEQLEHIKSEKLIDALDRILDYPAFDPHGDPIPSKEGTFTERRKKLLSDIAVGTVGVCVGVKDSSTAFLQFLDKHAIALGQTITVISKEPFDHSLNIEIAGRSMHISQLIANNLYLKINE